MARVFLDDNLSGAQAETIVASLQTILHQLQDQINQGTDVVGLTDAHQTLPQGMLSGDVIINLSHGEVRVGVYNGIAVVYASFGSFTGAITDSQHGNRSGGSLHDVATVSTAGFMSAADKVKSDSYKGDTSSAGNASLTEYPNDGDWGFHTNTTAVTYKLAKNKGGTIYTVLLT